MTRTGFVAVFVAVLAVMATPLGAQARSQGAVIAVDELSVAERTLLRSNVAGARMDSSAAFAAVARVRAALPSLDAAKRGSVPLVTPLLRLGPEGLYPLLSEIAVDGAPRGDLSESAWSSWRMGLVEATGALRDPRSRPVLIAILDGNEGDPAVVRAAAEALGKLGDDESVSALVTRAHGPRRIALVSGLGGCRRLACTGVLTDALAAPPDAATARLWIRELGRHASAWAWQTAMVARSGEGGAVRRAAARTLVDVFVRWDGQVRQAAANALVVVEDPTTPALVAAARRGADPALARDLDGLAVRWAQTVR